MDFDPQVLRAGTVIAGYRIQRMLGAGGFGITYEALSGTLRRYAIKEFFPQGIASREGATKIIYRPAQDKIVAWALDRFERSTIELARLKHPNIVEVFHYLKENNTGYMVMEFVEGRTLTSWLEARASPPSLAELRPLIEPVLDAIGYMHACDLIHRDIAPDNIMIRGDGRPMLIDFGAMKMIEQRTSVAAASSYAVAKAGYSSPEQVQGGERLDRRADIYSLGAVLYRAFTGAPPPEAGKRTHAVAVGDSDLCMSIGEATRVRLPTKVLAVIDRSLAIRVSERPESVVELRAGLGWADATTVAAPVRRRVVDPVQAAFDHAMALGTVQAFDGFLGLFPNHPLAERARAERATAAAGSAPISPQNKKRPWLVYVVAFVVLIAAGAVAVRFADDWWPIRSPTSVAEPSPVAPPPAAPAGIPTVPRPAAGMAPPDLQPPGTPQPVPPVGEPQPIQSPQTVPAPAPAKDASAVAPAAQRVVLYDQEDPSDPQGKHYLGSVVWRTETVSLGAGLAPELAIRADLDVPERRMAATISIRRNTDKALPASHTIELTFNLPADFPFGGVNSAPVILMKQAEQARGVPLVGLGVKVTANFFLVGLSSLKGEVQQNIKLPKERPWLDIPIQYNNGRRAILTVEKGTPGERAFRDAFAAWKQ